MDGHLCIHLNSKWTWLGPGNRGNLVGFAYTNTNKYLYLAIFYLIQILLKFCFLCIQIHLIAHPSVIIILYFQIIASKMLKYIYFLNLNKNVTQLLAIISYPFLYCRVLPPQPNSSYHSFHSKEMCPPLRETYTFAGLQPNSAAIKCTIEKPVLHTKTRRHRQR